MFRTCAFILFAGSIGLNAGGLTGRPMMASRHDAIVFSELPQTHIETRRPLLLGDSTAAQLMPPPLVSFNGYINDGRAASIPDCMGAAGPNHLMITINGLVIIQRRDGQTISSVTSQTFWNGLGDGAFDP